MLNEIIRLLLIFGLFEGTGILLIKRGLMNFKDRFYLLSLWFFVPTVIISLIYSDLLVTYFSDININSLIIISPLILIVLSSPRIINSKFKIPEEIIKNHGVAFFNFDYRLIITKTFDILLQQTMILVLILILLRIGFSQNFIIIIFSAIFTLIHIPLLISIGKIAIFHITAAFLASFIFSFLILKVSYGVVYSFSFHFLGYVLARILFWYYFLEKKGD